MSNGDAAQSADGLPDAARRQRVIYIRPEGELLMQAEVAFKGIRRDALGGRFEVQSLRDARGVIDELLRLAEQTEVA